MKKIIVATILVALSLSSFGIVRNTLNYVIIKNGTVFCSKVTVGIAHTTIKLSNGEKVKYDNADVNGYCSNGHIYMKRTEIVDNQATGRMVFMELMGVRNGFSIYKNNSTYSNGTEYADVLIFNNDRFVVKVDNRNKATLYSYLRIS